MIILWRIYYSDGKTFDSSMGAPHEAPGLGVIFIVQPNPEVGREIVSKWDWYYYRADLNHWWGADLFGLQDALTSDRQDIVRAVKAGRSISTPDFRKLFTRVMDDPDFPVKSGFLNTERTT